MNLLISLLVLLSSPKGPEAYYFNGKNLEKLDVIECSNINHAVFRLMVRSPFDLIGASIDSGAVGMCLPGASLRKDLKLSGRWYVIDFSTKLSVGSTRHTLCLESYTGRMHKRRFTINVEGSKRIEKPLGVKR